MELYIGNHAIFRLFLAASIIMSVREDPRNGSTTLSPISTNNGNNTKMQASSNPITVLGTEPANSTVATIRNFADQKTQMKVDAARVIRFVIYGLTSFIILVITAYIIIKKRIKMKLQEGNSNVEYINLSTIRDELDPPTPTFTRSVLTTDV